MAKIRKIYRCPSNNLKNYYLVDANFLARKFATALRVPRPSEQLRINACQAWWHEIDAQVNSGCARVYAPDICIAEAFKTIAYWYYVDNWFPTSAAYKSARDGLSKYVRTDTKSLRTKFRSVEFHDISTNRDIIISVDRFFEVTLKHARRCSVPDIILAATAKYLWEFYDIPKERLHIVTMDRPLRKMISKINELPAAYDPTLTSHSANSVFVS